MHVLYVMINNKEEQQEKDRTGREMFLVKNIKWYFVCRACGARGWFDWNVFRVLSLSWL